MRNIIVPHGRLVIPNNGGSHFKEHGVYWPPQIPLEDTLDNYIGAFETIRFSRSTNASLALNLEKIAIFRDNYGSFMHAARQLANGNWTSKLGVHEDIEHGSLAALEDEDYGYVCLIMQRPCGLPGMFARAFFKLLRALPLFHFHP